MQPSVRSTIFPIQMQRTRSTLRHIGVSGLIVLLLPIAAHAQSGSPFDTGFTSIQNLFTGTIAKVASLIAIVIGGYGFAHGEPGAKKALAGVAAGTGIAVLATNVLTWLWGRITISAPLKSSKRSVLIVRGLWQIRSNGERRTNRVFKSLHKPLTYLGVERTLFYFVCVGAVGAFNLFNSIPRWYRRLHRRLRLRSLGDEQRPGVSSHSRQIRAIQAPL